MYWCRTLGELALYADRSAGEPLVRPGKALAILTYVGFAPRRCDSRDKIVELFWPDVSVSNAHHNLRQALYRLRQAVPDEELLKIENGSLICSDGVAFDVVRGEEALAAGDFATALSLLRGVFMVGFSTPDAPEVQEWIESQRTRIGECFARAAQAVIDQSLADGRPEDALRVAEDLRATNPLSETRVRPFITVLDRAGQTRRALAEYEAYRSLLASALDDEPAEDLQRYAAELEESLSVRIENGGAVLPFVGRSAAWSTLLDEWERAERGTCSVVLIEGDAGLGKTRLMEEFAARVRARGGKWRTGKCYEMEQSLPYAVISHALRAPGEPDGSEPDSGLAFRSRVVKQIERLAEQAPVLLSYDDVHWADPDSLRLLHFAIQQLAEERLMLICSYRPAELSSVARRFAVSLASDGQAKLITLTPLSEDNVADMLATMGKFPDAEAARRIASNLYRHTAGNPLFLAELLESLERRNILKLESGAWIVGPGLDPVDLPTNLRKILTDRVDALPPNLRFALEVMAALADTGNAELVAPVLQVSEPQAELILAELASARLLRRQPFGRYIVAHDELRQQVYTAIPDDRRRAIHGALGTALEERGAAANPGGAARLTRHFEQAGDAQRAQRHALAAAGEAAAVGASEAQQSFLRLAQAFDAGDLEDRQGSAHTGPGRRSRRWPGYAAAAALVVVSALIAFQRDGTRAAPGVAPWDQGALYLEGSSNRNEAPPSRVEWPTNSRASVDVIGVEQLPPALKPQYTTITVPMSDGSHTKLFRIEQGDTIQVTTGTTDDGGPLWSPDRSMMAVQRGWRVGDQYVFNISIMDPSGRTLWQLTHGPEQDFPLDWSPEGTQIAFARISEQRHALWIADVDGAREVDLTDRFELPTDKEWAAAAFAPEGRRLAALQFEGETILLMDLESLLVTRIPLGCLGGQPAWSPDGEWLAVICRTAVGISLVVVSADGASGPHVLANLASAPWGRLYWVGGEPSYIASVEIAAEPGTSRLHVGEGLRLTANSTDPAGRPAKAAIRWSALDFSIVSVDEFGFVRALSPGSARIEASAGGFRSDTIVLEVFDAPLDTLLYESWDAGIDTTRWRLIGSPAPEVLAGAGPAGTSAMLSNGDHNWPSGVLSRQEYDLRPGLTLELPVRFQFTGGHWQELELGLMRADRAMVGNNERNPQATIVRWSFVGTSPSYPEPFFHCSDRVASGTGTRTWDESTANAGWHYLVMQVRPDTVAECYLDGELLGTFRISASRYFPRAALYLGGRSEETEILHGPVLVTRGLRH